MRALLPIDRNISRIDADSLSFLLETDDRELPFLLLVEQQRFDAAVQAMNERSRLHLEVVQPRLAAAGIVEGGEYSRKQLVTVLGDDLLLRIERATDVAIEHVDATVKSSTELIAAMYRAMKVRFPNQQFVRLAPGEPSNTPQQPTNGATERAK